MSEEAILKFEDVTCGRSVNRTGIERGSFVLRPSGFMIVRMERHVEPPPLFDLAQGLVTPTEGNVVFMGRDWESMGISEASEMRALIGRVFRGQGLVSNLNMFENIALVQRHYTELSDTEIHDGIVSLCERIGLRDMLEARPHTLGQSEQRKAQWVRAFLGERALLLLEEPFTDLHESDMDCLFELMSDAREAGRGVIILSSATGRYKDRSDCSDAMWYDLREGKLVEQTESDEG